MTRAVRVGARQIGGGRPVTVQSMLNTPSADAGACVAQARTLEAAGCEILRIAVPDAASVRTIPALKAAVGMPIVADIHFDYRLALESVAAGADKIRINPGNIGGEAHVRAVAEACAKAGVPIRVGVNSGSVDKAILARHGRPCAEALAESAVYSASLLEKYGFTDIVLSVKASDVTEMIRANRILHNMSGYPLHLGVTEAGTAESGLIKSSIGIGSLLCDGIGDTIRVSLTADPVQEVYAAKKILRFCGLRREGVEIVSCPTCGRTKVDLIALAQQVERAVASVQAPITVAIMGCAVNGPGEAREADIGLAGGDGELLLFKRGRPVKKVPESDAVDILLREIESLAAGAANE